MTSLCRTEPTDSCRLLHTLGSAATKHRENFIPKAAIIHTYAYPLRAGLSDDADSHGCILVCVTSLPSDKPSFTCNYDVMRCSLRLPTLKSPLLGYKRIGKTSRAHTLHHPIRITTSPLRKSTSLPLREPPQTIINHHVQHSQPQGQYSSRRYSQGGAPQE